MAQHTTSPWRRRARQAINAAVASVPEPKSRKAVLSAIFNAYPFGERAYYPYACWLAERKLALQALGMEAANNAKGPGTITYAVRPSCGRAWLEVRCGWCSDTHLGAAGCVCCLRKRAAVAAAVAQPLFRPLAQAAMESPIDRMALLDWCEERLGERPGLHGDWPAPAEVAA